MFVIDKQANQPDNPGLVEEVAVYLGPVEGAVANLHLDKVSLKIDEIDIHMLIDMIRFIEMKEIRNY